MFKSASHPLDALLPNGRYALSLAQVFFDESGSHAGSPVLCVAGYVFVSDRLKRFNDEWSCFLDEYGLTHFHMVDCAHGANEFKEMSKDDRASVAKKCIEAVKKYASRGIGVMVAEQTYDELMPYHPKLGGAYSYCIWQCLHGYKAWRTETGFSGDTAFVFESGHKSEAEANHTMNLSLAVPSGQNFLGYVSHTFADKRKFPGLQAADILAWQMHTDWKHGMLKKPRRKDFAYLIEQRDDKVAFASPDQILSHVSQMKAARAWNEGT